jgi:hypothetical protein
MIVQSFSIKKKKSNGNTVALLLVRMMGLSSRQTPLNGILLK